MKRKRNISKNSSHSLPLSLALISLVFLNSYTRAILKKKKMKI